MCRGCVFQSKEGKYENSDHTITDDYLNWLSRYQGIASQLDQLNKDLLSFANKVPDNDHKNIVDRFRRKIIKTRLELIKHEGIIAEVSK